MEPFHDKQNEEGAEDANTLSLIIQQKSKKKRKTSLTNDEPKPSKMARIDTPTINSPKKSEIHAKLKTKKVKSNVPIQMSSVRKNSKHEKSETKTPSKIKKEVLLLKKKFTSGKSHTNNLPKIEKLKQKRNKKPNVHGNKANSISDERLRAFGINPKKYHKKLNWEIKTAGSTVRPTPPKISKNATGLPKKTVKNQHNNKKVGGTSVSPNVKKIIAAKAKQNENNKKKLLKFLGKSPRT